MSGVQFVQVRHDPWCAAQHTQRGDDCVCNAEVAVVDQTTWLAGMNRQQRRVAARKARRQQRQSRR